MTNDPSGNNIFIHGIGHDGKLNFAGIVPTGGTGMHGNNGGPPTADALFSQGPIVISGNHLFAVNPGSNTVSMFHIDPANPLDIRMVGKPVSSRGEFPVSVDVSPKSGDVCVLNGGKVNGVACFSVDPKHGLNPFGGFHSFGFNLTTPPAGPSGAVTQVLFSPDGSKLLASVKGTPPADVGFVATWDVAHDGTLSSSYTKASPPLGSGGLPFGMEYVVGAEDAILVTDPALGFTIYDFSKPKTRYIPQTIPGQNATCWVVYSKETSSYFMTDVNTFNVYEASVDPKTLKPTLLRTYFLGAAHGPVDLALATVLGEDYIYVLSPAVTTFDVFALKKGGSKIIQRQNFGKDLNGVTFIPVNLVGAAVYLT